MTRTKRFWPAAILAGVDMRRVVALMVSLMVALAVTGVGWAGRTNDLELSEYKLSPDSESKLTSLWLEQLQEDNPAGGWLPMKADLTDEMLDLMGLPPRSVLAGMRFPEPTIVDRSGRTEVIKLPVARPLEDNGGGVNHGGVETDSTVVTYAGAGWFGIRPGAWLLLLSRPGALWCSMAHVYGSPGSNDISTAGHCGKTGDIGTVIAAFGNKDGVSGPVLLDFGTFATSTDEGLGKDWALIDIYSEYQHLVTPTMAFWGGPRGMYTKTGSLASVPDPLLAQTIVHYGHGTGVGAGGAPRAGEGIHWGSSHFMFFGVISFGDSGSGANTLAGDTVGASMQAAGILTHIWLPWTDLGQRAGLGTMAGTRATQVNAPLADGQLVPYPVPTSDAP